MANDRKPVVNFKGITKTYDLGAVKVEVLKGIDLCFYEGEYSAIMGPSGSGKSTLLNILGCLDKPTSGSYYLHDDDVSKLDDDQLSRIRGLRIGFIFQSFNLIPQLNVLENIEVPMFYQGFSEEKSRHRAIELAEMVGLGDRVKHRPFELSGGQQQRVAIARSLANDPLIILADEPTGNLDSGSGNDILDLLDKLHESGKTIIAVTHGQDVASRVQRVVNINDGIIANEEFK
ncbi:MAG: ABC transporter ATP-binding protein [Sedimentisphaeraceae bacterium JB056]